MAEAYAYLETTDDEQKTREAILQSLMTLGYKVQENSPSSITAIHNPEITYQFHSIIIDLKSTSEKTHLILTINHPFCLDYIDRVKVLLNKNLPSLKDSPFGDYSLDRSKEKIEVPITQEFPKEERVIIKIQCPYCRNLYDATLKKCSHCGRRI